MRVPVLLILLFTSIIFVSPVSAQNVAVPSPKCLGVPCQTASISPTAGITNPVTSAGPSSVPSGSVSTEPSPSQTVPSTTPCSTTQSAVSSQSTTIIEANRNRGKNRKRNKQRKSEKQGFLQQFMQLLLQLLQQLFQKLGINITIPNLPCPTISPAPSSSPSSNPSSSPSSGAPSSGTSGTPSSAPSPSSGVATPTIFGQPTTAPSAAPTGSSTGAPAIPTAIPSGFSRAFTEDFNTPAALGSFDSAYGNQFGEYTGCCSTNKITQYSSSKVLYVQNGSMFYNLHSEGGQSYAAAPQPWNEKSFTYGQVGISVKLDSSTGPGYKIAFLLWPATNQWSNEVDFPEVDPDFTAPVRAASLNYSPNGQGENGFSSQDNLSTGVYLTDHKYHTFLLTWTPGSITTAIDGKTVATFTGNAVPSQAMRLSLQAEGWINQGAVPTATTDVLEVPWVYINTRN